jgi:DUF4097 and DUF4098 domain-containing protein YvlB
MSWLYTIVFAGLLISSNNETTNPQPVVAPSPKVAVMETVDDVVEKFEQSYPFTANGRVSISNVNGPITVEAWDRNEIRLEATKIADSQETMALMEIVVDARSNSFSVKTNYKHWNYDSNGGQRRRKAEVQYRLQVPKGAVLDEVESVNGAVNVSNFVNIIKVSAVNGTVYGNNLRGRIQLSTVNGVVKTDFDRIEAGTSIALETVNGRVHLELPSDVNATVKADTLNGPLTNEFGLPVKKGKYVGRNLHGRIGSGDVQVNLSAVNGSLSILRKKDGKSLSPVTNLVRPDSEDEDSEEDLVSVARTTNKAISDAARESARATQKAAKESQKAVEKLKNELPRLEPPHIEIPRIDINEKEVQKMVNESVRNQREAVRFLTRAVGKNSPTSIEQKVNSFPVKGTPKVTIQAPKCKVFVRGWDQQTVKYVLTESRGNRSQPISVNEDVSDRSVSLVVAETARPRSPVRSGEENALRLELFVPKKSDLSVHTEEEIRLLGVSGELELVGEDEPISVRDAEGSLRLTSENGLVRVVGFKGKLDMESSNSDVYLEGDFEKIDSHALDGNITLTLPPNKNASISTNAAIESEGLNIVRENGRTWRLGSGGAKYDFEFSDGSLVVRSRALIETN